MTGLRRQNGLGVAPRRRRSRAACPSRTPSWPGSGWGPGRWRRSGRVSSSIRFCSRISWKAGGPPFSRSVPARSIQASSSDRVWTSGVSSADRSRRCARFGDVFAEVRLDHHGVGTGLQRLEHRHGRMDAVQPRDVAAGRDHAPLAAADDDRPVAQFGPVALLHRGVEGVAVQVGDGQLVQLGVMATMRRDPQFAAVGLAVAGWRQSRQMARDGSLFRSRRRLHVNLRPWAPIVHGRRRQASTQSA
jgi:hypothetical protein